MEIMENGIVGRLLLTLRSSLYRWYEGGTLCRLVRGITGGWTRWFHGSAAMDVLCREGTLPRSWRTSLLVRGLEAIANLPAAVLHWIYRKGQPVFDGSFFASLGFAAAGEVSILTAWLMLGFLVIPYKHWDNMYSLEGFLFLAVLFILGGMRKKQQRLDFKSLGPYPMLFAGAVVLGWLVSYSSALSFRFIFFHITCMVCVLVTVSAVERTDQLVRLAAFAAAAMAVLAGYGIIQRIQGVEINYSFFDPLVNEGMPGRVFSLYENPNSFAEVLVLLIPLAVALLLGSRSLWGKLGGLGALALAIPALLMTYSRASWIGWAVSMAVFVFFWDRKLLPGLLLLAVFAIPLLPSTVFNRILTIFNMNDTSTSSRFPLYAAALEMIKARPVRGAGLGTDAVRTAINELNLYHGSAPFVHAHNLFLQIWLETGLLGIVSYLVAMISGVKSAAKAARHPKCPAQVSLITIAALSAVCGILVDCMADYLWNYPRVMLIFWFVFALMLSGIKLSRKAREEMGGETV